MNTMCLHFPISSEFAEKCTTLQQNKCACMDSCRNMGDISIQNKRVCFFLLIFSDAHKKKGRARLQGPTQNTVGGFAFQTFVLLVVNDF